MGHQRKCKDHICIWAPTVFRSVWGGGRVNERKEQMVC